jgi:hypothetical protein
VDIKDIKIRLNLELKAWFKKQCANPFDDFYFFYIASTPEHNGGFIIAKDQPANKAYQLALNNRLNKSHTIEQVFNSLIPTINRLPIIE